jgi:hypothetical protein
VRVADAHDPDGLTVVGSEFRELVRQTDELQPPMPPRKLGNLEEPYRQYRDDFRTLTEGLDGLRQNITRREAEIGSSDPNQVIARRVEENSAAVTALLDRWTSVLSARLDALRSEWSEELGTDRNRYRETINPYLHEPATATTLVSILNL